jgi:hypothetical protein
MSSFPLGHMKALTFTQFRTYSTAINTFNTVQSYNSNVSTLRFAGNKSLSYYTFASSTEETNFILGNMLLLQNDPSNSNLYVPVQKN